MNEPGYFERLSQRALTARKANGSARNGAGDAEPVVLDPSRDRLVAQRYRLEKRIGRGRLGDIFEAVDEAVRNVGADRRVAIQLVDEKIASNQRATAELAREFAVLRTSSHPNVVRILDFGMEARQLHVAMDLLEGVSLRAVLDEAAPEPLAPDEVWPVILAVGEALQYLHAKGLTHGAVRPESVLITLQYGIKLLDLAPHLPSVAPFYVEDLTVDASTKSDPCDDVYGLACLAYELLSGRHPFNANTPLEAHRAGMFPRPLTTLDLRDWDAIDAALELERSRRTPTVKQFLDELGLNGNERLRVAATPPEPPRLTDAIDLPPLRDSAPSPARSVPLFQSNPAPAQARAEAPVYGDAEPAHAASPPARDAVPDRPAAAGTRWILEDTAQTARRARARADDGDEASTRRWSYLRGALQATFALVVIAGVAAFGFLNYDSLKSAAARTIAAIDDKLDEAAGRALPDAAAPPAPAGERSVAEIFAERAPVTAPGTLTPAENAAPVVEQKALDGAAATAPPATTPTSGAPAATGGAAATGKAAGPTVVADPHRQPDSTVIPVSAPAVSGAPVPTGTEFGFARPLVAVSERESAVAVVISRFGNLSAPASVAWWVEGDTAIAEEDYPEFGQKVERFAPGQASVTVFIPLVRDSLPERTETFRVFVGRADPNRRHLDATSSMQVEIIDDD